MLIGVKLNGQKSNSLKLSKDPIYRKYIFYNLQYTVGKETKIAGGLTKFNELSFTALLNEIELKLTFAKGVHLSTYKPCSNPPRAAAISGN
jgi:hypothetical protein